MPRIFAISSTVYVRFPARELYLIVRIPTLTYTIEEYEPLDNAFARDTIKGYIYPGVKIEQVKYIIDSREWMVFENISS